MKAITIFQPWASLIAVGAKRYETRGWKTGYRGPIAIHAGVKPASDILNGCGIALVFGAARALGFDSEYPGSPFDFLDTLPCGAVIATAELVECWSVAHCNGGPFLKGPPHGPVLEEYLVDNRKNEFLFGDWREGRYAWELANVKPLAEPVPARGRLGLWDWEEVF